MPCDISLYVIIDPQIARGRLLADMAAEVAKGGATLIQYRAKACSTRTMIEQARMIGAALAPLGVPLLVNDRADVALASGAQGVHLGREDMSPRDARRLLGPTAIIGATIKSEADFAAIEPGTCDYGCIGGVFATTHKNNADAPLGLAGFRQLRAAARAKLGELPVGAIAGIRREHIIPLFEAGAEGVAVIGAALDDDDITGQTRYLREALDAARSVRP